MEEKSIPSNEEDETFDSWTEQGAKDNEEGARTVDHYSNLVHRVFAQSDAGRELLAIWKESLLMTPVANPSSTKIEIGIQEGMNQVTRTIINICKSVEAETNQ